VGKMYLKQDNYLGPKGPRQVKYRGINRMFPTQMSETYRGENRSKVGSKTWTISEVYPIFVS